MSALLRPPRPGDETGLGPLHNAVWRQAYDGLVPADYLAGLDDAERTVRWAGILATYDEQGRGPQGNLTRVVELDGAVVGFGTAGPARDDDPPASTELWALYVATHLQGTGLGHALLGAVLPPGPAYLWVLHGNARATGFYERQGFEHTAGRKPHPPTGAVELQMVRTPGATAAPTPS